MDSAESDDDVLMRIVEVGSREHFGITFTFDEYYKTDDDTSFGGDVLYRHSWNDAGRFRDARARASSFELRASSRRQLLPQSRDEQEPAGMNRIL